MTTILIGYASDYGNTEKMAQAAADGINSMAGCSALIKKVDDITAEDMLASDGILLGSPVHMGEYGLAGKKMIDTVCAGLWMGNKVNGKVAGVFVSGGGFGGAGGGAELAMLAMLTNFAELGMLILPLPKMVPGYQDGGLHWGPYGRSANAAMEHIGVSDTALSVVRQHGIHLARVAAAIAGKEIFAP